MVDSLFFALYLNAYLASKKQILEKTFEYAKENIINGIVVDVKESGYIFYDTKNKIVKDFHIVRPLLKDLKEYVRKIEENNLKPIARFVCFVEYSLAQEKPDWFILDKNTRKPWKDKHGAYWLNPYKKEVRNYLISILKELKECGFKEIHLDYVRFPSDGDLDLIFYEGMGKISKEKIIEDFLKEVKDSLKDVTLTACTYGFVCFWGKVKREGQDLELMGKHLDKFAFMLYPSHFGKNFLFIERNNENFYGREFLIYALAPLRAKGIINTKISVYVQAFDLRAPSFGKDYIKAQLEGAYLSGVREFYFWNARGSYEEAIKAIKEFKEEIKKKNKILIKKEKRVITLY
ncbi:MAG: putative glycoside hydrolase [candidate division WOR-3 bacterium]